RPKGAFLIPLHSRARNHGFGGERADEQTDRSRSRPQRDHRESASQSSYEENGSEIGGRSGQDGRSTRGEARQIAALRKRRSCLMPRATQAPDLCPTVTTCGVTAHCTKRNELMTFARFETKVYFSIRRSLPTFMYEATLSGPRLCWPGPRTKVRSRGRGAGNLDHRR